MPEINGILYFRRQAIQWKYPELRHGKGKDFRVFNMDRNPESKTYGQENITWNTDVYPKPTDEETIEWYNEFKYLQERKYESLEEQLDRLTHDIESGLFGEDAKTGQFYLKNKAVKDVAPKPGA